MFAPDGSEMSMMAPGFMPNAAGMPQPIFPPFPPFAQPFFPGAPVPPANWTVSVDGSSWCSVHQSQPYFTGVTYFDARFCLQPPSNGDQSQQNPGSMPMNWVPPVAPGMMAPPPFGMMGPPFPPIPGPGFPAAPNMFPAPNMNQQPVPNSGSANAASNSDSQSYSKSSNYSSNSESSSSSSRKWNSEDRYSSRKDGWKNNYSDRSKCFFSYIQVKGTGKEPVKKINCESIPFFWIGPLLAVRWKLKTFWKDSLRYHSVKADSDSFRVLFFFSHSFLVYYWFFTNSLITQRFYLIYDEWNNNILNLKRTKLAYLVLPLYPSNILQCLL